MKKKTYTKEFKLGAARMVVDEKMKPSHVAKDLGISDGSITKWVQDYRKHGSGAFPGKGMLVAVDQEKRDLERRLRRAELERDLLKKTISIFAELDRKGTA
jgi:transposase